MSEVTDKLEREKIIKQEVNRIKKVYKNLEREKVKVVDGLINEAAFMKLTLEETRLYLFENGMTEIFEQGPNVYNRERPEVKIYTSMIQRYSQVMKQLIDFMPIEQKKEEADQLLEFISKGKIKK